MMSPKTMTLIYNRFVEPRLVSLKIRIVDYCKKYNISPVLDVCCGTGKQCDYFSRERIASAGLDLKRNMVSFASMQYRKIPFVLGDASFLPLKGDRFKGVTISLALHDKDEQSRRSIIREAKKLVGADGYLVLLDFENPWNAISRWAFWLVYIVELFAGWRHFREGRRFLQAGGLAAFIQESGLEEVERYNSEKACSAIVVTKLRKEAVNRNNNFKD